MECVCECDCRVLLALFMGLTHTLACSLDHSLIDVVFISSNSSFYYFVM